MSDTQQLSRLERLWLGEALRLREEQAGPVEDAQEVRQARAAGGDLAQRVETRALLLSQRDGLLQAQRHWRQGALLAGLLLWLLALGLGAGMGSAALGDGLRPVNVFWALGSLLGLHLLALLGWLASLALADDGGGALGRLWLWSSARLARDARAAQLAPALLLVLQRARLGRWLLGLAVHGLWLSSLLAACVTLAALLATHRYSFVWETTLLGGDTFVSLTHLLGLLPGALGFAVPDAETVRASGADPLLAEAARQAWASWLLGVLLVYGVLPRALLTGLCLWRWRRGQRRLRADLSQPGYALLRERLQPSSERLGVNDAAPAQMPASSPQPAALQGQGALLVAIELDPRHPWPPRLPKGVADAGVLDSGAQRRRLLDQLTQYPPERLAIACDPRRSPDRGSLALIAELAACARATRIWLLPPGPGEAVDCERLQAWQQALDGLALVHAGSAPLEWLEHGHD